MRSLTFIALIVLVARRASPFGAAADRHNFPLSPKRSSHSRLRLP
jgi:hypothetical protein